MQFISTILVLSMALLYQSNTWAQTDAQSYGYVNKIEGVSYSQLRVGNESFINNIELYSFRSNTVSDYVLVQQNQTYNLNMASDSLGVLEFNLKSSSSPVGYFVSIDNVPVHAAKRLSGQELQFFFSSKIFGTVNSKTIKVDILKKVSNTYWTKVQTRTFNIQRQAITPPPPPPDPLPPGGYVPPNTTTWTRYANNLVINPAKLKFGASQMAMYNIGDPCVMFDKKTNKFHAYFSTADMGTDVVVMGHAESADGASWSLNSQTALGGGAAGSWDRLSIETCSVHSIETSPGVFKYYMFYSGTPTDSGPGANADLYKIGLAVSDNANVFTRIPASQSPKGQAGLLFDIKDAFLNNASVANGLVTDPDVIYENGTFKMWFFCGAQNSAGEYFDGGICYATSTNGINFTQRGTLPSLLNTSTVGVVAQQPSVVYNPAKGLYEMWLVIDDPAYANIGQAGLAVGGYYRATSPDGINWTYASKTIFDFAWNKNLAYENVGMVTGPDVLFYNNTYYMYYPSFTTQGVPAGYYQLNPGQPAFTWGLNLATKK